MAGDPQEERDQLRLDDRVGGDPGHQEGQQAAHPDHGAGPAQAGRRGEDA